MSREEELQAWIKDGYLRSEILNLLSDKNYLPSELSESLRKHRASISRALNMMESKGIIRCVDAGSRTRLYQITSKGKSVFEKVKNGTI